MTLNDPTCSAFIMLNLFFQSHLRRRHTTHDNCITLTFDSNPIQILLFFAVVVVVVAVFRFGCHRKPLQKCYSLEIVYGQKNVSNAINDRAISNDKLALMLPRIQPHIYANYTEQICHMDILNIGIFIPDAIDQISHLTIVRLHQITIKSTELCMNWHILINQIREAVYSIPVYI